MAHEQDAQVRVLQTQLDDKIASFESVRQEYVFFDILDPSFLMLCVDSPSPRRRYMNKEPKCEFYKRLTPTPLLGTKFLFHSRLFCPCELTGYAAYLMRKLKSNNSTRPFHKQSLMKKRHGRRMRKPLRKSIVWRRNGTRLGATLKRARRQSIRYVHLWYSNF
jgi:hypothetical protein